MDKKELIEAMVYHQKREDDIEASKNRIVKEMNDQIYSHQQSRKAAGHQLFNEYKEEVDGHSHYMTREYVWIKQQLHVIDLRVTGQGTNSVDIVRDTIVPAEVMDDAPTKES